MAKRKILILNMCNHHDFYGKTVEVIEDTWAKDIIEGKYENISYYSCGAMTPKMFHDTEHRCLGIIDEECHSVFLPVMDKFVESYDKFFMLLKTMKSKIVESDYIFITQPCTYVNVPLLDFLVQNFNAEDRRIYCGKIYAPKYSCGPYLYSLFGGFDSLLLSRADYFEILSKAKYRNQAIHCDTVNSDEFYKMLKTNVAQNATGFILNSAIAMQSHDPFKYYLDWNMRYFRDMDEEEWEKQITILAAEPGHKCGDWIDKLRYIHEIVTESIEEHGSIDASLIADYIGVKRTIIVVDENNDPNKEPVIYQMDGEEFDKMRKEKTIGKKTKIIKASVYTSLPNGYTPLGTVTTAMVDGGFVLSYVEKEVAEEMLNPDAKKPDIVIPEVDPKDDPGGERTDDPTAGSVNLKKLTSWDPKHWAYDGDKDSIPDIL